MQITEVKVLGDSDKEYTIAVVNGVATCTCPAFIYYKGAAPEASCKHMRFVVERLSVAAVSAP